MLLFPIDLGRVDAGALHGNSRIEKCPRWIPYELVFAHEKQMKHNYRWTSFSFSRLSPINEVARQGGLSPAQMVAVLNDREFQPMPDAQAVHELNVLVDKWQKKTCAENMKAGNNGMA